MDVLFLNVIIKLEIKWKNLRLEVFDGIKKIFRHIQIISVGIHQHVQIMP